MSELMKCNSLKEPKHVDGSSVEGSKPGDRLEFRYVSLPVEVKHFVRDLIGLQGENRLLTSGETLTSQLDKRSTKFRLLPTKQTGNKVWRTAFKIGPTYSALSCSADFHTNIATRVNQWRQYRITSKKSTISIQGLTVKERADLTWHPRPKARSYGRFWKVRRYIRSVRGEDYRLITTEDYCSRSRCRRVFSRCCIAFTVDS